MAHAERCPVCHGSGKLSNDGKSTAVSEPTCHGCWGRGWVTVEDACPALPSPHLAREPEPLPVWHWSRQVWAGPPSTLSTNGQVLLNA
jgi:hypothetical protein